MFPFLFFASLTQMVSRWLGSSLSWEVSIEHQRHLLESEKGRIFSFFSFNIFPTHEVKLTFVQLLHFLTSRRLLTEQKFTPLSPSAKLFTPTVQVSMFSLTKCLIWGIPSRSCYSPNTMRVCWLLSVPVFSVLTLSLVWLHFVSAGGSTELHQISGYWVKSWPWPVTRKPRV